MRSVPPDGPIPCDLAVVGESPSHAEIVEGIGFVGPSGRLLWKREPQDIGLIDTVAERPRSTVYVTNVCKNPCPENEWRQLPAVTRTSTSVALLEELDNVKPKLVLAFGTRAASICLPSFSTMTMDHGKPDLGATRKWMAMALWHPAAYLRGNHAALGMIAADLAKVSGLLVDGLAELCQPEPPRSDEWPEAIAFLRNLGPRKSGRCQFCGANGVSAYEGEGLKWKLCKVHAERAAEWAESNLEVMREHQQLATAAVDSGKRVRAAGKMQADLLGARRA